MCVRSIHVCSMCTACLGEFLEQLGTIRVVDLVDFVSKIELPNTFRRSLAQRKANSSSSLVCMYVTYTYICMYAYVCVRIYEYEARIPVSFAAQAPRTKDRATGVNETSLLHAPSASSFKMKSKWDI